MSNDGQRQSLLQSNELSQLKQTTNSNINIENNYDINSFTYEELFQVKDINDINDSSNPKGTIGNLIERFLEKKKGKVEIQSNLLMTQAEFHLNNLNFLQENFKNFPQEIICKILNLLSLLLNLEEEKYNINLPKSSLLEDSELQKYTQVPEPDFSFICKRKFEELKYGFKYLGFFPTREEIEHKKKSKNTKKKKKNEEEEEYKEEKKEEEKKEEKKVEEKIENFYLNTKELQIILDYIKSFYFPFIRLFYHFININRITETKNVEVIINRPLPVPPLCEAVEQKLERNIIDEKKEEEEEEKEENENDKNEEKGEGENINDEMNQINMNNEIRKLVTEKVNELRKDVDARIFDNQNEINRQVEDIMESANPKKK